MGSVTSFKVDRPVDGLPVLSKVDLCALLPDFNFNEFMQKALLLNYEGESFIEEELASSDLKDNDEVVDASTRQNDTSNSGTRSTTYGRSDSPRDQSSEKGSSTHESGADEDGEEQEADDGEHSSSSVELKKQNPFVILEFKNMRYPLFDRFKNDSCDSMPLLFSFEEQWELANMLFEGSVAQLISELRQTFQLENDVQLDFPQLKLSYPENIKFAETTTLSEMYALHIVQNSSLERTFSPLQVVLSECGVCFKSQIEHLRSLLSQSESLKFFRVARPVIELLDDSQEPESRLSRNDADKPAQAHEVVVLDDERRPSVTPAETFKANAEEAEALEEIVNDVVEEAVYQVLDADASADGDNDGYADDDGEYEDDYLDDEEFAEDEPDPIEALGKIETFDSEELHNSSLSRDQSALTETTSEDGRKRKIESLESKDLKRARNPATDFESLPNEV